VTPSPNTYRARPTIEAMQWDGTAAGATPIIDWVLTGKQSARYHGEETGDWSSIPPRVIPAHIALDRPNGCTDLITAGDFVVKLDHGFVKADRDAFEIMYEATVFDWKIGPAWEPAVAPHIHEESS
jgi:hypothetical protein